MMVVVYRGTLVHCVQSESIEVLRDHLIGFNEQSGLGNHKLSPFITLFVSLLLVKEKDID